MKPTPHASVAEVHPPPLREPALSAAPLSAQALVVQRPSLVGKRPKVAEPLRAAAPRVERDHRIDFFRGIALLVMVVDHNELFLEQSLLSLVTYAPIGITTGAAAFVFLSGIVLGLASVPILVHHGFFMLQLRCLARAWQLYAMQMLAFVICVAVTTALPVALYGESLTKPLFNITNDFIARFATFRATLQYFDILPLYIFFLACAPAFLALAVKRPRMAWFASFALYAIVQAYYATSRLHELPFAHATYYQPLAWQFLFAMGLLVGVARRKGSLQFHLSRKQLLTLCLALVVLGLWYKLARVNAMTGWLAPVEWQSGQSVPFDVPGIDKPTLGPMRILHFLAVVAVVATIIPASASWLNKAWSRAIRLCGRHSLEVFVTGIILNYACLAAAPAAGVDRFTVLALDGVVVLLSLAAAFVVEYIKRQPWKMAAA